MYKHNLRQRYFTLALTLFLSSLLYSVASADSGITIPTRQEAQRVNQNKVGVVFTHEELFHQLVHNMESELEHDSGLRIVPIMGKNHVQSVYDLLYLKGIDLALVRADAIEYVKRKGNYPTIGGLINSVVKVSDEKIVVIARKDYETLEDLDGQVVGFGLPGSGEYVTSTIMFETLGIEPDYVEVNNTTAIEKMKSGELAAMVYLLRAPDAIQTGADLKAAEAIKNLDLGDDLHFVEIPETASLSEIYTPVTLGSSDLPGVIDSGVSITSYSVDAILAVYRWTPPSFRFDQTERFVNALVDGLDGLSSDVYQPAWKRVDLEYATPNITSTPLVAAALDARAAEKVRLIEAERQIKEQAIAEAKAAKIAQLVKKRNELTARIGNELNEADAEELELMLEELNTFLEDRQSQ
ncbi:MAG: TAXI family TRAP transporter solute-binding subunit [Granulosicoccus sp.]